MSILSNASFESPQPVTAHPQHRHNQVEKLPARARQSVIEHIEGLVAKYGNNRG